MLTLNQAVQQLNNIANSHANIKSFYFGELWDFASSGSVEYPAMAVTYENASYRESSLMYSFNVYIMDRVDKGLVYRTEIVSDTLQVCLDVLALLDRDFYFKSKVNKNFTISDFTDRFNDEVTGNWFRLDISTRYPLDSCAVPLRSTLTIVEEMPPTVDTIDSIWTNLKSYYTADNTPNDYLSYANGTLVGSMSYGTGIVNNGFLFPNPALTSYISLPDGYFNTLIGSFTLALSVKFASVPSTTHNLLSFVGGDYEYGCEVYMTGKKIYFSCYGTFGYVDLIGTTTILINTWYRIVVTRTSIGSKLYINSTLEASNSSTDSPQFTGTIRNSIGATRTTTDPTGIGFMPTSTVIDEVAIINGTDWTQTQVTQDYNSGVIRQYPY